MILADALATTLRDWDLKYIFGVGGANIEHLFDAVHRHGRGRLQTVCAKSEIGAAFMADSRARAHRTLGVCCATSGGGMLNLAVGVAESFAESVPVLAIVGQPPTQLHGRGAFQDSSGIGRTVNADALWSAITKFRATIETRDQFWTELDAAVRAAVCGRPGPSVLMIPRDLYDCEVGPRPAWLPHGIDEYSPACDLSPKAIHDLFSAVRDARSPVLLVGDGVNRCREPGAIGEFAHRFGMRTATTLASKNSFPNDDPLYLGMAGVAGEPSVHRFLKEQADLIVAVGTDLNAMTTQPIQAAFKSARLAVVNADVSEVLRVTRPSLVIEADEGAVFSALTKLCDEVGLVAGHPDPIPLERYTPRMAPRLSPLDSRSPAIDDGDDLLQSEALELLQKHLPRTGQLLFDAGNCAAAALHYLSAPCGVNTTIALGMGGMGYSIAAAIGAQLGSAPNSRTMVICGDGAFLMLGAEVNTAVHYDLPILFVVFNNGMHGMCVTRQQVFFEGRIEGSRYPAVSILDMARGLGSPQRLWAGSAGTIEGLNAALTEYGERAPGPGVLELRLTREEIPPFTPFLSSDAPTYVAAPLTGVGLHAAMPCLSAGLGGV